MEQFAPPPCANLATISLSALDSSVESLRSAEISRLVKACETFGFFYLTDHGVPTSLLQRIFSSSRTFFRLPEDIKQQYGQHVQVFSPQVTRGYVKSGVESANPKYDVDNKESFELGNERPLIPGQHFTGPNVAPPDDVAPDFTKSEMELNGIIVKRIAPSLVEAFAVGLGCEDLFADGFTEEGMLVTQRTAYYPPGTGAIGRHTDGGLFTVLIQESQSESSSLKIFSKGKWCDVKADQNLFVVNVGNMLQYWSGGRFRSTPHQVIHNGSEARISLPIFVYPNADANIIPLGKPEDKMLIAGELYLDDLSDLWGKRRGAGFWTSECRGKEASCNCWRCM